MPGESLGISTIARCPEGRKVKDFVEVLKQNPGVIDVDPLPDSYWPTLHNMMLQGALSKNAEEPRP